MLSLHTDAEDAAKELNGYRLEEERLIVQVANRARDRSDRDRDSRRDRDRDGRDRDYNRSDRGRRDAPSDSGSDRCYNCGEFGKERIRFSVHFVYTDLSLI
jgi:hypothetical protein